MTERKSLNRTLETQPKWQRKPTAPRAQTKQQIQSILPETQSQSSGDGRKYEDKNNPVEHRQNRKCSLAK